MKVIITGGSGFIGQALTAALLQKGYRVSILDLIPPPKNDGPLRKQVDFFKVDLMEELPQELFKDTQAIIHLAGKNLFGRWNKQVKESIYQSRILGTKNLVTVLEKLPERPKVLVSASAVGIYGDRGEEELDESSALSSDFLARVCMDWEKEARVAEKFGVRTVQIRTAPVLGTGGLLSKLLPIYKLGLGGPIASGQQWFPWVHIKDIVNIYIFALENENLKGPVNTCSPEQVRNKEFSSILAKVIKRPHFLRVPKWSLKLLFNDLADFIVASQKVYPKKLLAAGYKFSFPHLKQALENILL